MLVAPSSHRRRTVVAPSSHRRRAVVATSSWCDFPGHQDPSFYTRKPYSACLQSLDNLQCVPKGFASLPRSLHVVVSWHAVISRSMGQKVARSTTVEILRKARLPGWMWAADGLSSTSGNFDCSLAGAACLGWTLAKHFVIFSGASYSTARFDPDMCVNRRRSSP